MSVKSFLPIFHCVNPDPNLDSANIGDRGGYRGEARVAVAPPPPPTPPQVDASPPQPGYGGTGDDFFQNITIYQSDSQM